MECYCKRNARSGNRLYRSCFKTSRELMRRGWRRLARNDDDQYCQEIWGGGVTPPAFARRKQWPREVLKQLLIASSWVSKQSSPERQAWWGKGFCSSV